MTTKKKIFVAIASLAASVAIVVVSVFATVAYLTSSAAVSNVFTIGNVGISMTESKVNPDGTLFDNGTTRVDTNTYHLVPNKKYIKDPAIVVNAGSEDSYLFVLVRNDLESIEATSGEAGELTIAQQLLNYGWKVYTKASTGSVYVYHGFSGNVDRTDNSGVNSGEVNTNAIGVKPGKYKLFDYFVTAPKADISKFGAAKITLTAVAIQTSGFGNGVIGDATALSEAWAAVVETYPYIHTGNTSADTGNTGGENA